MTSSLVGHSREPLAHGLARSYTKDSGIPWLDDDNISYFIAEERWL